jgi:hypothetical protein
VPLVKEILITVPSVLMSDLNSHTVMNVHMVNTMMVSILNVKTVDLDSHGVSDVTKTDVSNVIPTEVPQIVDVLMDMSTQLLETTTDLTNVSIVTTCVLPVKETLIPVNNVLTKPVSYYHTAHVLMVIMMIILKIMNVTYVTSDVSPVLEDTTIVMSVLGHVLMNQDVIVQPDISKTETFVKDVTGNV